MDENVRAHVIISGRVQGVFFRAETQRAAARIGGIGGWVRNRSEGTVEAVFEGGSQAVEKAVAWCRQGSPMSQVTDVKVTRASYTGEYDSFDITY